MLARISQRQFIFFLLFYYFVLFLCRILSPECLTPDEAEQMVHAQRLSWGYGPQPPLYTWIQILFFKLLGSSVAAHFALKHLILFLICFFLYKIVNHITAKHEVSCAAVLSLMLLPAFSWDLQIIYTHSALVSLLWLATIYFFIILLDRKTIVDYIILSFCITLGILSKYNYIIFIFALMLAASTLPQFRKTLSTPKTILLFALPVLLLIPHLLWCFNNQELLFLSLGKAHMGTGGSWLNSVFLGLTSLFSSFIFSAILLILFFLPFIIKELFGTASNSVPVPREYLKLILRAVFASLIIFAIIIIFSEITHIKTRWILPALLCLPILFVCYFYDRFSIKAKRRLSIISLIIFIAVPSVFLARPHLDSIFSPSKPEKFNFPYETLAKKIKENGFSDGLIIVMDRWVGGNIKRYFPNNTISMSITPVGEKWNTNEPWLILWIDSRRDGTVFELISRKRGIKSSALHPVTLQAPYKFHPENIAANLKMLIIDPEIVR